MQYTTPASNYFGSKSRGAIIFKLLRSMLRTKYKTDPQDRGTYTFAELSGYYSGWYPWQAIQEYWDYECIPVFVNKGMARAECPILVGVPMLVF